MTARARSLAPGAAAVLFILLVGLFHAQNCMSAARAAGDPLTLKLYAAVFAVCLLGTVGAVVLFRRERAALHRIFFVCGLLLGLLYLIVMPGLSAPDELGHYATAYRLSSVLLQEPELTDAGLIAVRARDYPLEDLNGVKTPEVPDDTEAEAEVLGNPVKNSTFRTARDYEARYASGENRNDLVSSALPDVRTTPVMYLPQAVGFAAARALGLGTMALLFCGKFLNLLVFLILVSLAIRETPVGKELFFGTALLPMSLHLASSLSYDTGILGTSFLFTAVVFRLAYGAGKVRGRDVVLLSLLIAALGPCKMIYSLLVFLPALLIPAEKFGGRARKAFACGVVFVCLLIAMAAVNAGTIGAYAGAAAGGAETEVSARAGYSAAELIRHPGFVLRMVCNTFSDQGAVLTGGLIGMHLGNLDPLLGTPFFAAVFFGAGLLLLSIRVPGEEDPVRMRDKVWCALIFLGVVLAAAGAMLLSWTTRGASEIEGVQGRYFLPVLPLLLLALRNNRITMENSPRRLLLCGFAVLNFYTVLRVLTLSAMRI